jgi:hypothetical protein
MGMILVLGCEDIKRPQPLTREYSHEQEALLKLPLFKSSSPSSNPFKLKNLNMIDPGATAATGADAAAAAPTSVLSVFKVCSNRYTAQQGTNLLASGSDVTVALFLTAGDAPVATTKFRVPPQAAPGATAVPALQLVAGKGDGIVADVVRSGKFESDLKALNLADGEYKIALCAKQENCSLNSTGSFRDGTDITMKPGIITVKNGMVTAQSEPISVLYDQNDQDTSIYYAKRSPLNSYLLNMSNSRHKSASGLSLADDPYDRSGAGVGSDNLVDTPNGTGDSGSTVPGGGNGGSTPNGGGAGPGSGSSDSGGSTTGPCDRRVSPLMLDIADATGGIELSVPRSKIFDLSAVEDPQRVVPDSISWMSNKTTYFLAFDKNGNGSIDSGFDLFGDVNINPENGMPFENGFEDLAQYDTNHDNIIDSKDPIFASLRLWQGEIKNGVLVSQPVLKTLPEMNIIEIDLNYERLVRAEIDIWGNATKYRSFVIQPDAKSSKNFKVHRIFDVFFRLYSDNELKALYKVAKPQD